MDTSVETVWNAEHCKWGLTIFQVGDGSYVDCGELAQEVKETTFWPCPKNLPEAKMEKYWRFQGSHWLYFAVISNYILQVYTKNEQKGKRK